MSKAIDKVFIRSCKFMALKLGPEWSKIENAMVQTKHDVPIYYQELQPKEPDKAEFPKENIIGYARNIRVINDVLVCDVILNSFNKLSSHFNGMIDNYGLSITQLDATKHRKARLVYKLDRFIVYDKDKKREVDAYVSNRNKSNKK